jgi:hypothetical protein
MTTGYLAIAEMGVSFIYLWNHKMAVYRQIQITYWQDKFVLKLTPEEKFFYIYLLTNSKTKQCGIYELPLEIIQVETGYNRETVIKLIQKFIDYNKIKYDWENEEVFLLNWIKHNPITNINVKKCVIKELQDVHNRNMIPDGSPLKPLISPLQALPQKEKEKEQEQTQEEARLLWISIFLNNAGTVETDFIIELFAKYGKARTKRLLRDFKEQGFHNIRTMRESLDVNGNIKPKTDIKSQGKTIEHNPA